MSIKAKWILFAFTGFLLSGFGISLIGEAIISKMMNESYFWLGLAGLSVFHAGLSFFGMAVIYKKMMMSLNKK